MVSATPGSAIFQQNGRSSIGRSVWRHKPSSASGKRKFGPKRPRAQTPEFSEWSFEDQRARGFAHNGRNIGPICRRPEIYGSIGNGWWAHKDFEPWTR